MFVIKLKPGDYFKRTPSVTSIIYIVYVGMMTDTYFNIFIKYDLINYFELFFWIKVECLKFIYKGKILELNYEYVSSN